MTHARFWRLPSHQLPLPCPLAPSRSVCFSYTYRIHIPTGSNGHQANDSDFLIDGIDDAKAAYLVMSTQLQEGYGQS